MVIGGIGALRLTGAIFRRARSARNGAGRALFNKNFTRVAPGPIPVQGRRVKQGIVLASASPRRKDLLAAAGYRFEVRPSHVPEEAPPGLTPGETVLFIARRKAAPVARADRGAVVLAADTVVVHRGEILGKPRDAVHAAEMLGRLAGDLHEVFTGVWIQRGRAAAAVCVASRVVFRPLDREGIGEYLRRVHTLDKAGAYAAQEDPVGLIRRIDGSRTNVIGLPMEAVSRVLRAFGVRPSRGRTSLLRAAAESR
jgi:septum formation protein